jgi:hypothetical protein
VDDIDWEQLKAQFQTQSQVLKGAKLVAEIQSHYYDALTEEGFTDEQALVIMQIGMTCLVDLSVRALPILLDHYDQRREA